MTTATDNGELAARWRELAGASNWVGLLNPIDPLLRQELIRYGEFVQACYDSFDFDRYSRYCGTCKYHLSSFFDSLGKKDLGYDVTRYLYATSNIKLPNFSRNSKREDAWSDSTNWMGYVAVSDDETSARLGRRDIVVSWRGTVTKLEWLSDLTDIQRSVVAEGIPSPDRFSRALAGFLDLYTDKNKKSAHRFARYSAREQAMAEVRRLVALYAEERGEDLSISVTGHSLGSALATLSAYDLAELGLNRVNDKRVPVCVYSYGGPRVGNRDFKERFEAALGLKCIRVMNVHDVVPKVPGVVINENSPDFLARIGAAIPWNYTHVGVKVELDHKKSPFLKDTSDISCYHNLEAHLHLLDGHHGDGKEFKPAIGRDPALVNKSCDFLAEKHLVPPSWRQDADRGLSRSPDGRWKQPERPWVEDFPADIDQLLDQIGLSGNGSL